MPGNDLENDNMKFFQIAKRTVLFLIVNILVMVTLSALLWVLGVQRRYGNDGYEGLLIICCVMGMGGAFISLLLSRWMVKMFQGVQVVDPNTTDRGEQWLVQTIYKLSRAAHLSAMPEVGIYPSPEVNAFATGPSDSQALVAVSAGLLRTMRPEEIEGVLGHEITHIANGDMVTMTLIQGVVNTIAMFLGWVLAMLLSQNSRGDRRGGGSWFMQYMMQQLFQSVFMVLGFLVVAKFSRWREFRADAGGARLAGRDDMLAALRRLKVIHEEGADHVGQPNASLQALQISGKSGGFMALMATHPPIEERIARLERPVIG
jgi:heat shock protein HtpX